MRMSWLKPFLPLFLLPLLSLSLWGAIIHTSNTAVAAPNTICEVPTGYATIQAAISDSNCTAIHLADGVYTLDSTLTINRAVTIQGESRANTILDGQNARRLFDINDGNNTPDKNITISNLTLRNGYWPNMSIGGAGIISTEALTLTNITLFNNNSNGSSGAVYNFGGHLTIENVLFQENSAQSNGGAITTAAGGSGESILHIRHTHFLSNSVTSGIGLGGAVMVSDIHTQTISIEGTLFEGNDANQGGALYTRYATSITNTAFVRNQAYDTGGGAFFIDNNAPGDLQEYSLLNVTLAENRADRGSAIFHTGAAGESTLTVINSTIYKNIGTGFVESQRGVVLYNETTFGNTIIANNDGNAQCFVDAGVTVTSLGGNLSSQSIGTSPNPQDDTSCQFTDTSDMINVGYFDNILQDLASIPTPSGYAYFATPNSPVLDTAVSSICPAFDAQGSNRPFDGDGDNTAVCDRGAIENIIITDGICTVDDDGPADYTHPNPAAANSDCQLIDIEDGTFSGVAMSFSRPVTVTGNGPGRTTLIGNGIDPVVYQNSASLTIRDIVLREGSRGIFHQASSEPLHVTNVHFVQNSSTGNGAGILTTGPTTIVNGDFRDGSAEQGGAIYAQLNQPHSSLTITDTLFVNNSANSFGGAIHTNALTALFSGLYLEGNNATNGAGIFYGNNTPTAQFRLLDSWLDNNSASVHGGGLFITDSPDVRIERTSFTSNMAGSSGGAMRLQAPNNAYTVTVHNSTLSNNEALSTSAIAASGAGSTVYVDYSTISQNHSSNETGSALGAEATLHLSNSIISNNSNAAGAANCSGNTTSSGYNIEDTNTCGLTANGDQPNTDPQLLRLEYYRPNDLVYPLAQDSPAINAASPLVCPATDDRGAVRSPGNCDIGAYERLVPMIQIGPIEIVIIDLGGDVIEARTTMTTTAVARIPINLSEASPVAVEVMYETQDGTAVAGTDYTAVSGTLTFAPDETSKTIEVPLNPDTVLAGAGLTFEILLSSDLADTPAGPPPSIPIVPTETTTEDVIYLPVVVR